MNEATLHKVATISAFIFLIAGSLGVYTMFPQKEVGQTASVIGTVLEGDPNDLPPRVDVNSPPSLQIEYYGTTDPYTIRQLQIEGWKKAQSEYGFTGDEGYFPMGGKGGEFEAPIPSAPKAQPVYQQPQTQSYYTPFYDTPAFYQYDSYYERQERAYQPQYQYSPCSQCTSYTPQLRATCTPKIYYPKLGDTVQWSVDVSGGNGSYEYVWFGEGVVGENGPRASVAYDEPGSYSPSVTVTSGGQTVTTSCYQVYIAPTPLTVSCGLSRPYISEGDSVEWSVRVEGSSNYSIKWRGHDEVENKTSSSFNARYNDAGYYTADVTITAGTQTKTAYCGTVYVNQEYVPPLYASCYPDRSYASIDENVTWRVEPWGGDGDYDIDWSGTGDIDGNSREKVTISYDRSGSKEADVRVCSGKKCIQQYCGSIYVEDERIQQYNFSAPVQGSCFASPSEVIVGENVLWQAQLNTASLDSRTIIWNGSESLNEKKGARQTISYITPGVKYGSFSVRNDDGRLYTFQCTDSVNVRPGSTEGMLAVSLNEVPYTGPGTAIRWIIIALVMLFWSYVLVTFVRKKKHASRVHARIKQFKEENRKKSSIA